MNANSEDRGAEPQPTSVPDVRPAGKRSPARVLTTLLVLAAIAAVILYLEAGPTLPFRNRGQTSRQQGDSTFFSLDSQSIKLGPSAGSGPRIGTIAPDFTLLDLAGKPVRLGDLKGKTVVINFWATWCGPCREEFPELVKTYEQNKDAGLLVLGVDLQENRDIVRRFADDFGASYPILIDDGGAVAEQYRLVGVPTSFFVDSEGVLRGQQLGLLTADSLKKKLDEAGFQLTENQK